MPGSSLWLLPPKDGPLNDTLASLIKKTSASFNSPHLFIPHVTLTSEIDPETYGADAQGWLDSLSLVPADEVHVRFQRLASEDVFFRKLYIQCQKSDGLKKLGELSRAKVKGYEIEGRAKSWAESAYNPHISLLYHDCPQVDTERLSKVENLANDAGVGFTNESHVGWEGGRVVLVPTDKPIDEWIPIAEKQLAS